MNIKCHCGKKAVVWKVDNCNIYCHCSDTECDQSVVAIQSFKRSVKTPHEKGAYLSGNKVMCGCGSVAVCYGNNNLTDYVKDNYYQCIDCGHKFVMSRVTQPILNQSA